MNEYLAKKAFGEIAKSCPALIARSAATKQSTFPLVAPWIASRSLAMTKKSNRGFVARMPTRVQDPARRFLGRHPTDYFFGRRVRTSMDPAAIWTSNRDRKLIPSSPSTPTP
jgi:hypothetical protein